MSHYSSFKTLTNKSESDSLGRVSNKGICTSIECKTLLKHENKFSDSQRSGGEQVPEIKFADSTIVCRDNTGTNFSISPKQVIPIIFLRERFV